MMATPAVSLTAIDLRLLRLAQHSRKRRITAHAIDAMRELCTAAGFDTAHHPIDRIGNLVDELVMEADSAGRVTRWTDTGNGDKDLDAWEVHFEGCEPVYAIGLPSDVEGPRDVTIVNLLSPWEYKRSSGGPRWRPRHNALAPKLAAMRDSLPAAPPEPARARVKPEALAARAADGKVAPTVPREEARLTSAEERSEDTGGALITYVTPSGSHGEASCPWEEVPKQIAHLVETGGVKASTIALYRRVPFQVRTTINVTIGG